LEELRLALAQELDGTSDSDVRAAILAEIALVEQQLFDTLGSAYDAAAESKNATARSRNSTSRPSPGLATQVADAVFRLEAATAPDTQRYDHGAQPHSGRALVSTGTDAESQPTHTPTRAHRRPTEFPNPLVSPSPFSAGISPQKRGLGLSRKLALRRQSAELTGQL
jgi:hypothetical protein